MQWPLQMFQDWTTKSALAHNSLFVSFLWPDTRSEVFNEEPKPKQFQSQSWAQANNHFQSTMNQGNSKSYQSAKKVMSHSPGLVDFAIGLVNSVPNLPDGQAKIFRKIKIKIL